MRDLLMPSDFQLLFEATPHPYLVLRPDAAFTIAAVNERYLAATGTRRDAIVGHGVFDIFPDNPEDASEGGVSDLRTSLNRVVADRRPDVMGVQKYDIPRRDGSGGFEVRYWSPVNTPVFGPTGDLLFITHHVEDVTEFILSHERASHTNAEKIHKIEARAERSEAEVLLRAADLKAANRALKNAMEALESREAELARLNEELQEQDRLKDVSLARALHRLDAHIRNSPLAVIEFDPAFRVIRWSETAELLFGWRGDEIVGRNIGEIRWIHEDDAAAVARCFADMLSGISPRNRRANRNYRKDGAVVYCEWYNSALYDDSGNLLSILSQGLDVTERERIAAQICASEEKYRILFANMTEGFLLGEPLLDPAGKVVDLRYLEVNEAFYRHTGMARGITERPLREHLPQVEQEWIDRYATVALTGRDDHFEMYNADTDRYYDVHAFSPSPGRFAVLFRDTTERKAAEKERERLNADLERRVEERTAELKAANRELEGFTFATSHDLKGPLGRINSFSTLLEREYRERLEGNGLLFLDIIRQNATRLTRLVEDLLSYAQISQQRLELQKIDVLMTVQAIVQEKIADQQEWQAETHIDLPPVQVLADPLAFHQAMGNLVENALKYSSKAPRPRIDIGGELAGDRVRLWVRDNGIGFKMQYHDRIFEIFKRLHTQSEYAGSGVGLALVKRAMERMGGRVWAESAPDQGAVFFLELQAVI